MKDKKNTWLMRTRQVAGRGFLTTFFLMLSVCNVSLAQSPYTTEPKTAKEAIEQVVWA